MPPKELPTIASPSSCNLSNTQARTFSSSVSVPGLLSPGLYSHLPRTFWGTICVTGDADGDLSILLKTGHILDEIRQHPRARFITVMLHLGVNERFRQLTLTSLSFRVLMDGVHLVHTIYSAVAGIAKTHLIVQNNSQLQRAARKASSTYHPQTLEGAFTSNGSDDDELRIYSTPRHGRLRRSPCSSNAHARCRNHNCGSSCIAVGLRLLGGRRHWLLAESRRR